MATWPNIVIPNKIFRVIKEYLDGIIFHREVNENTEIKFIGCYVKYIPKEIIQILEANKI